MKNILFVLALVASSFTSFAQFKSAQLVASGLTCSMCSKSIFKALKNLQAVDSVDVDIDKSVFSIYFKQEVPISPDEIKDAVTGAGFAVADLRIVAALPSIKLEKDTHFEYQGATYHVLSASGKTISGNQEFRLVDKDFVPAAEFKKIKKGNSMECVATGKSAACCHSGAALGARVYHIVF